MDILSSSLILVGPGRAGRAFARSWRDAGGSVAGVVGRDRASAEEGARRIGQGTPEALDAVQANCDLLLVSVPDDALEPVGAALAGRISCRTAFHFSGALPAERLAPLRARGAALGSLHPLRPFTGAGEESWEDAFVAIEGDLVAVEEGERVLAAIRARGYRLDTAEKPLYHAAATLAAGGTAAVLSLAIRAWARAGLPEEDGRKALGGLSARAASAVAERPFEEAFTGPLARRDLGTVRAHRQALEGSGEILALYALLAEETLRRTPDRGKEEEIRALLRGRKP